MEIKMDEKLIEELVKIAEEYINELNDETVENAGKKRNENWAKARQELEANKTPENQAAHDKALKKLQGFSDLHLKRQNRKQKEAHALRDFRDKLEKSEPVATRKADLEHLDAMLTQYNREKLEKLLAKKLGESYISEACFYDILAIMEDVIDFNKRKRKEDRAKEINRMMASGELESVRQLPNGEIMGDAKVVQKLKDMKKED